MDEPDQDLRPAGQAQDRLARILEPVADAPVEEIPRRGAMPRIVEAQERPALRPRPGLERQRLRPLLVRAEPAKEHDTRPRAFGPVIGDPPPGRGLQILTHARPLLLLFSNTSGGPGVEPPAVDFPTTIADRKHDIPATGRTVGAKPTRRMADGPDFPDIPRWQQPRFRQGRDRRRSGRRHRALARQGRDLGLGRWQALGPAMADRGGCEDRHPHDEGRRSGARAYPPRLRPCHGPRRAEALARGEGHHRSGGRERLVLRFRPGRALHA